MTVASRQNAPKALDWLVAQRFLYRRAKIMQTVSLGLAWSAPGLVFLDFGIEAVWFSQAAIVVVLFGWFVDQTFIVRRMASLREEAATMQEAFDSFVLTIPWPEHLGVERPTEQRVAELAKKGRRIPAVLDRLDDWYTPGTIPEDPILATTHCQRMNCSWDEALRKDWRAFLVGTLTIIIFCVVLIAVLAGISVLELVLAVAACLRGIAWIVAELRAQSGAATRAGRIHRYLSEPRDNNAWTTCDTRLVQDGVLQHRRTSPTVPDWFYRCRRTAQGARFSP